MITTAFVLAMMLGVAEPGCTDSSRVYLPFEECDALCVAAFVAQRGSAPALNFSATEKRGTVWIGWSVRETRSEGLSRYAAIAQSIALVANASEGWPSSPRELVRSLVTIARHESAFWRGVHDGTQRGPSGERGLWQVHPSLPEFEECMPGVTIESTVSCADVAARLLTRARRACGTVDGMIALYGSGASCHPPAQWATGVAERMRTFNTTSKRRPLRIDERLAVLDSEGWWQ